MKQGGFTLAELLVALTVTLLLATAVAGLARPARQGFERLPAELDRQQRGRAAIDLLSQAVRSSRPGVVGEAPDESGVFAAMTTIVPVTNAAQGIVAADQPGPDGSITLAVTPCPSVKDVCGFTPGATAVITDADGSLDVFVVASTDLGHRRLTPDRVLSRAYPSGSAVLEVEASTFSLVEQTDGSYSLTRATAAGAVQPIVDFVSSLEFTIQSHQVEMALSVQASTEALRSALPERVFRASVQRRNVP